MSDFNPSNRSGGDRGGRRFGGGGRGFGGRGFGGGRDFGGDRMMHKAVCANCGNECEVPFRPSGERPVYCSNCFEKRNNEGGNERRSDSRNFDKPRFDDRRGNAGNQTNGQIMEQLKSLNAKMDRLLNALDPKTVEAPKAVESNIINSIVAEPKVKDTKTADLKAKKAKTPKK